ncbi:MAG TPA: TIGR03668 family PPOX class F420-dependent oxidoreductase [Gaiellales bacterium]|jgi:PPOX class probable F420-dependent enzyme
MELHPDEARELFATARVARLATVGSDGAPHIVPICFALAGGTVYSAVDGKPKRTPALARLRNIDSEPRVALLADHYDEDWARLWWVRLDGKARLVSGTREREQALRALTERYAQYRDCAPQGAVIAVEPVRWVGWRA